MTKRWYETLYENFDTYGEEPYVQNTGAEVDFVEQIIAYDRAKMILDVGCGNGRHTLELARRGYNVLGSDLSEAMLAQGRRVAAAENLDVTFKQADARDLPFQQQFDVVIMLCEGGFSLMENDEMDLRILSNVSRALKSEGQLIMTSPNAAFMLAQSPDDAFDVTTLRETFALDTKQQNGAQTTLHCTQRYYTCPELNWMLGKVGFQTVNFFACTEAGYDLTQKPTRAQFEFGGGGNENFTHITLVT